MWSSIIFIHLPPPTCHQDQQGAAERLEVNRGHAFGPICRGWLETLRGDSDHLSQPLVHQTRLDQRANAI